MARHALKLPQIFLPSFIQSDRELSYLARDEERVRESAHCFLQQMEFEFNQP